MEDRDAAQEKRDEQAEERRRRIVERLNAHEGGLNDEALKNREELEHEREKERQLAIEKGKRHSGY